jgi:hypothetical protein
MQAPLELSIHPAGDLVELSSRAHQAGEHFGQSSIFCAARFGPI